MGRLNSEALSARWRTDDGAALAEEAVARLVAGRGLAGLGLGEHEGRVDLRCLPAPVSGRLRRFEGAGRFVEVPGDLVELRGVSLAGLDLSGAVLPSLRLFGVRIEGCRLDGASCRDWRMWGTTVADSSFAGADLRGSVVGSWHEGRRNEWRRVDFQGADLRHAVSWAALFEDCDFARARLDSVRFEQCALARCRFSGSLRRVAFDGRELPDRAAPSPLDGVDFRAARFEQVEFLGCKLDRAILPEDPDLELIPHYRCVVERSLALLEDDGSLEARILRAEFTTALRMMRAADEDFVFNRRDYRGRDEGLLRLAEDVYRRAQAACR